MSSTFEVFISGEQYLTTPDISVRAVARTIQCESDHSVFQVVLCHATGDVRMVMLYAHQFHSTLLQRPFGGKVVGVKVVGDNFRPDFENALQVLNRFVEETITLDILQIADVLAQEGVLSFGETDRVLEFAADGQHRRLLVFQKDRHRNESARTPQLARDTARHAHYGIIAAQQDVAVMY